MKLLLTCLIGEEMETGLFSSLPKVTWQVGHQGKNPGLSWPHSELFKKINSISARKSNICYDKSTFSKFFRKLIPQTCDLEKNKTVSFY